MAAILATRNIRAAILDLAHHVTGFGVLKYDGERKEFILFTNFRCR